MVEYKDLLETKIEAGDYITYSVRQGDNPVLRLGRVLELKVSKHTMVSKAGEPQLLVRAYAQDWDNNWVPLSKLVTLTKLSRVIVLDPNQLSTKLLNLLDKNPVENPTKK